MRSEQAVEALRQDIALFRASLSKFTGLLAGKKVSVEFRGSECATNGSRIVLPAFEALANVPPDNVAAARRVVDTAMGLASHEVGHVLFTDFEAWAALSADGHQRALANVVEDSRIEARMRTVWHGSGEHLDRYATALLEDERPYFVTKDAYTQVCLITGVLARGPAFEPFLEAFSPELVAWCRKYLRKSLRKMTRLQDTAQALRLARRMYGRIAAAFLDPPPPPSPGGDTTDEDQQQEHEEESEGDPEPEDSTGTLHQHRGAMAGNGAAAAEATDTNKQTVKQIQQLLYKPQADATIFGPHYAPYTTADDYTGPMRRKSDTDWLAWHTYFGDCRWREPPDMAATFAYLQSLADKAVGPLRSHLGRVLKAKGVAYEIRDVEHGKLDRRRLWKVPLNTTTSARVRRTEVVGATYNLAV